MTEEMQPTIDGKPAVDADPNKGIELDRHGDPVRQGTLMIERESYERVIEGLKIAADASMHLVKQEPEAGNHWRAMAQRLDIVRRIAVQHAGLGEVMRERQTESVRGDPMKWRKARDRLREGLIQCAGGMRQLATCHRGDFWWSRMATTVEEMERKIRNPKLMLPGLGRKLILPPGFH